MIPLVLESFSAGCRYSAVALSTCAVMRLASGLLHSRTPAPTPISSFST